MQVGDIVRQGDRIVKIKGRNPPTNLGIVVEIEQVDDRIPARWAKFLGRTVTVLWENGNLTKNMAENALELVPPPPPCPLD